MTGLSFVRDWQCPAGTAFRHSSMGVHTCTELEAWREWTTASAGMREGAEFHRCPQVWACVLYASSTRMRTREWPREAGGRRRVPRKTDVLRKAQATRNATGTGDYTHGVNPPHRLLTSCTLTCWDRVCLLLSMAQHETIARAFGYAAERTRELANY
eukprot:1138154-Pelagomonas_calceolata.AAC.7